MTKEIFFVAFLFTIAPSLASATVCAPAPTSSTIINVKNYGATGNGSTNDTSAINSAIGAVPSGGTVYIPDGIYMIDALTSIKPKSNMTLSLSSGAVLKAIPNNQTNYNIISIDKASNVNVIGGTVKGERYEHKGSKGEWGMGIGIYTSTNIVIEGTTVRDVWGDGFYLDLATVNTTFCSVVADNNRRQGMSIILSDGVVVKNSIFKNTNGTAPSAGIDMEPDSAGAAVRNVQILSSQFISNKGPGILSGGPHILGNTVAVVNVTINNNLIESNGTSGEWTSGVQLEGINVSNNKVMNNFIRNSLGQGGVLISDGAVGNFITGNTFCNNSPQDITGETSDNKISGNITSCTAIWNDGTPTVTLTSSPTSITSGQSPPLTWSSTNTTSARSVSATTQLNASTKFVIGNSIQVSSRPLRSVQPHQVNE
jgi:hypothetical protein